MNGKGYLIVFIVMVILLGAGVASCSDSPSSSSGKKWSELSDVEKANAMWAYEAQQAINNYR